jgi:hypothetical protein
VAAEERAIVAELHEDAGRDEPEVLDGHRASPGKSLKRWSDQKHHEEQGEKNSAIPIWDAS